MITIHSKYNIGDKVWLISENKVVQTTIIDISISRDYSTPQPLADRLKWKLDLTVPLKGFVVRDPVYATEDQLFSTKQELIASL